VSWLPVGEKLRCDIHDRDGIRLFGKLEQCHQCMVRTPPPATRIEAQTDEEAAPAPDGCISAVERERTLTQLAIYVEQKARDILDGADACIPDAVKLLVACVSMHRAAGEYTVVRERRNYVARLERTVARLRGGRN
jgi:hypothetical protein